LFLRYSHPRGGSKTECAGIDAKVGRDINDATGIPEYQKYQRPVEWVWSTGSEKSSIHGIAVSGV